MIVQLVEINKSLIMFANRAYALRTAARSFGTSSEALVKTAYYDMHIAMGGKMVPFAGYELPVQVRYVV